MTGALTGGMVSSGPTAPQATAAEVWEIVHGHTRYWAMAAGVELGVFTAVNDGARTAEQIATACGAVGARLRLLLDSLVAMGLLRRDGDGYLLGPAAAAHLVPGATIDLRGIAIRSPGSPENWPRLAATLRGERPPRAVDDDVAFWGALARATFDVQHALAARAAEALGLHARTGPVRILDVGCGAAPWALALLEAMPAATAVVTDLPGVVEVAVAVAQERGLGGRVSALSGDYRTLELGSDLFDLVVLANVVRTEGEGGGPLLLRRAVQWLRPGGRLLLVDYVLDDASSSFSALHLGLTMVANTERGAVFASAEYRDWLEAASLRDIVVVKLAPGTGLLVGRRPEDEDHG